MEALDGNAIAGQLFEFFGTEMTLATGTCARCGTSSRIAELRVYLCAPGSVARCPSCGTVVIVLVDVGERLLADLSSFELRESA